MTNLARHFVTVVGTSRSGRYCLIRSRHTASRPRNASSAAMLVSRAAALFDRIESVPLSDRPSVAPQLTLTVGEAAPDPDRDRIGRILSVAALQSLWKQRYTIEDLLARGLK